jgi:hypothetical protein
MHRPVACYSSAILRILCLISLLEAPAKGQDGPAADSNVVAAAGSDRNESIEDVVARLKKLDGIDVELRRPGAGNPFETRREIVIKSKNWDQTSMTLFVVPALSADRVGEPPMDFSGALAVEVIATDRRYAVVAPTSYDPDVASKVLVALGQTLSREAERRRLAFCAANWLDLRLAVARNADRKPDSPQPLTNGPTPMQIEEYTRRFAEKGYNGGRRHGDPYLWFPALGCCEVLPLLVTTADRATSYVLLSDKPDEVLLCGSKRPRPWYLKRVQTTQGADGRAALELEFDDVASARIGRLMNANPGRALALVFNDQVLQVQVIDGKWHDKLVVSGKVFDQKSGAGVARALRECMLEPTAGGDSGSTNPPRDLKAVEQALKPVLEAIDLRAKVEYRDQSLIATFLPQTFKIHGRNKSGAFDEQAHDEIGPSVKGFVLKAQLQPLGDVNQAVTPQTIHNPYWLTDLDVTPIAKTDKQLYWALSYGSRTDQELLNKIRGQLKGLKDLPARP